MPYVTLPEQGIRQPGDVINDAAHNYMLQQALMQQTQQQKQAFPIEQQQRQAQANESTVKAQAIGKTLQLQQAGETLANQHQQLANAFQAETDPVKKQQLAAQLQETQQQIQNLGFQASLIQAQTQEAGERTKGLQFSRANTTVTPGKLDPYGNQIITTDRTDDQGNPINSQQTFEKGRGVPRVAYKQVFDPTSGMMKRVPGVVEVNPQTGEMNVQFPDEKGAPEDQQAAGPDPLFKDLVDKYYDSETGKRNDKAPKNAMDRAQLQALKKNPAQLEAYGLDAYADGQGTLPKPSGGPVNARPTTVTSSAGAPPGPSPVSGASSAQPSATTSSAPPVAQPNPANGPQAGINPGGSAVKAGADALPAASTGTPMLSGRKPMASGGGKTFKDLPVGAFFFQGGKRFKKTGDTDALPADSTPSDTPGGSQNQTLPAAAGGGS
jgi:hypothetical protein